jgi:hypothetical protein
MQTTAFGSIGVGELELDRLTQLRRAHRVVERSVDRHAPRSARP